jgi:class 3 adenylate cyclase
LAGKTGPIALFALSAVHRIVSLSLSLTALGFLALFGLQFGHSPDLDTTWIVVHLHQYGDLALGRIGSWVNLTWPPPPPPPPPPFSYFPVLAAGAVWAVNLTFGALMLRARRKVLKVLGGPVEAGVAVGMGEGARVSADTEAAREDLLKRYREIEDALKAAKRKHCTFLSVDIVGSTEMKKGEAENAIAATFQAYEEMLRNIFESFGAWKQAWTPDGVMICFLQSDLAVGAAQRILNSLPKFNEESNRLKTPISVRCGLNEGEVPIYEDSRLEKIADRVIDVAGHMQKHGTPNALWLSKDVFDLLADKTGFREIGREVDGYMVCEWNPEGALERAKTLGR